MTKASIDCRTCGAGRWAAPGSADCTVCAAGRSSSQNAAGSVDSCIQCPTGTEALPGSAACDACRVGWADIDLQPASLCIRCAAGRFSATGSTDCKACAKGRADLDLDAATDCTNCAPGRYSLSNSTSCIQCMPGFSDDDMDAATTCAQCNQGFYTMLISSTGPCISCDAGRSTVSLGAISCEDCPAGKVDDDRSAATACTNCSVGQYSPVGVSTCRDCGGGSLDDDLDPSTPCARCSVGRFESIVASVKTCVDCSAGRHSSVEAASSASACQPCERGFADVDRRAETPCSSCTAGKYASEPASTVCTGCVAGTYSETLEATSITSCIACAPGFSSLVEAASTVDACEPCPVGQHYGQQYENVFGCVNCSRGRFSDQIGATDDTACLTCPAGTSSNEGAAFCIDCPRGSYAPTGSANCRTCLQGKMATALTKATDCVDCPAGQFATVASAECRLCFPGRFAPPGQGTCGLCAPGSYADTFAAPECSLCTDGYASSAAGAATQDVCVSCVAGFFADARVVCAGCTRGQSSLDLAMACEKCEFRDACIGNGECLTGYGSDFCSSCVAGFFRTNRRCHRCPDNSVLLIVLAAIVFLLVAMMVLKMGNNSRKTSSIQAYGQSSVSSRVSVPISILWTELQFNLAFFELDLQWPSFVLDITHWLKTLVDFDFAAMTAPECAIRFTSAGQATFARMAIVASGLPFFCVAICLLHVVFNSLIALQSQRVRQAFVHLFMTVPRETANACVIGFTLQYVMMTRTAAEAFDCRQLDRDGAPWRLDHQREVRCAFGADMWWPKILMIGIVLVVTCTFLPLLLLRHLRHKQRGVIFHGRGPAGAAAVYTDPPPSADVDQAHLAESTVDGCEPDVRLEIELADEAVSAIHHDRHTLTVMGWLFVRFRPAYYWWEFVIMGRKFLLTLTVVFLGSVGSAGLSLALCGTLITLLAQLRHSPFREDALTFAAARRADILRRQRAKHAPWESHIRRAWWSVKEDWKMPSLNGLQIIALTAHLVTLACGMLCLISNDPNSSIAIVAGYASLLAILVFVGTVVRYMQPRCGRAHDRNVQRQTRGSKSIRSRSSRRIQPFDGTPPPAKLRVLTTCATGVPSQLQTQQAQADEMQRTHGRRGQQLRKEAGSVGTPTLSCEKRGQRAA